MHNIDSLIFIHSPTSPFPLQIVEEGENRRYTIPLSESHCPCTVTLLYPAQTSSVRIYKQLLDNTKDVGLLRKSKRAAQNIMNFKQIFDQFATCDEMSCEATFY